MSQKLLLFDIDGTLLDSGGAGLRALNQTASEIFHVAPEQLPALDLAGATDGSVLLHYVKHLDLDPAMPWKTEFQERYLGHLHWHMHSTEYQPRLLDGAAELVEWLSAETQHVLGLLTGNWRRGAYLKLKRFGLDHHFADGGFGDDGVHRNDLGPHAVRRLELHSGSTFSPHDIFVIGDTPKDIAGAKAIGARCIAMATGAFNEAQLQQHEPWKVLRTLSDRAAFEACFC